MRSTDIDATEGIPGCTMTNDSLAIQENQKTIETLSRESTFQHAAGSESSHSLLKDEDHVEVSRLSQRSIYQQLSRTESTQNLLMDEETRSALSEIRNSHSRPLQVLLGIAPNDSENLRNFQKSGNSPACNVKIQSPKNSFAHIISFVKRASSEKIWRGSSVAPAKGPYKAILLTPVRKAERASKKFKTKRLRKVHFNLPKIRGSKRMIAQVLDHKSPVIRRWQSIMLAPLSYELWAFPFRLALGSPSLTSNICFADMVCDAFFIADLPFALCTAVPDSGGGDASTTFQGIAWRYFTRTFPTQFLPCMLYWIATPVCAQGLAQLCPAADRRSVGGGMNPWDSSSAAEPPTPLPPLAAHWQCVVLSSRTWPVWVWWLSTVPRIVPRALRLKRYFKAMESDLVLPRVHLLDP